MPSVHVRLRRKHSHYVTTQTTFIVRKPSTEERAFIEVIPLDREAPVAHEGARFVGSETDFEAGVRRLATDWKRTGILTAVGVVILLLLVGLTTLAFPLWAFLLCVAVGAAATYYCAPAMDQHLRTLLSSGIRTEILAWVIAFLAGYLLTAIILSILKHLLRVQRYD